MVETIPVLNFFGWDCRAVEIKLVFRTLLYCRWSEAVNKSNCTFQRHTSPIELYKMYAIHMILSYRHINLYIYSVVPFRRTTTTHSVAKWICIKPFCSTWDIHKSMRRAYVHLKAFQFWNVEFYFCYNLIF